MVQRNLEYGEMAKWRQHRNDRSLHLRRITCGKFYHIGVSLRQGSRAVRFSQHDAHRRSGALDDGVRISGQNDYPSFRFGFGLFGLRTGDRGWRVEGEAK